MARDLNFRIQKVEGLYYPCSENKGADQLCGYRTADLRLCFRINNKPVFSCFGIIMAYTGFRSMRSVCDNTCLAIVASNLTN